MKLLCVPALLVLLLTCCGCGEAKYGKCHNCEKVFGMRGGNLPGQATVCNRCGGHVYWPRYKSLDYYQFKEEYGGTQD